MRRTAHRREKQQPNETGGFRFAVTLLAAFGTLSYAGYNYLQTTPVDPYRYWFVCRLIAVAVILVLGLLFYILIKGYSMEVHDDPDQKNLEKWASRFYRGVFLVFACLLAFITFALVLNFVFVSAYSGFMVCIVLTVVFVVVFSIVLVKTFLKKNSMVENFNLSGFFSIFISFADSIFRSFIFPATRPRYSGYGEYLLPECFADSCVDSRNGSEYWFINILSQKRLQR